MIHWPQQEPQRPWRRHRASTASLEDARSRALRGDFMLELQVPVPTVAAPSIVPDETIDRAHLFKMTLGDHSLEGEVLRLFDRQCRMLLDRMKGADASCVKALAHTIDGSARGVGAWRVARAACAVEIAANGGA